MGIPDDKYAEYLLARFRQLGNSTTKWALLFLIALLYTWVVSIYPKAKFINDYITITNKYAHFDSLTSGKKKVRKSFVSASKDSLSRYSLLIVKQEYDTNGNENLQRRNQYRNLISTVTKAESFKKESGRLKLLLDSADMLKGTEKTRIKDTIKKYYLPIDILIAMSEMRKADAEKQRDSLLNKVAVTFNVPGLSTLNFGFRAGLAVWMMLAAALLSYLFSTRLKMVGYLKDIYNSQTKVLGSNTKEWNKLDLQVPFWIAPIRFKKGDNRTIYGALIGWRFILLSNIAGLSLLLFIMCLQFYTAWLCWHVSVIHDFENGWFKIVDIVCVFISLLLFLFWIQPVTFSPEFALNEHFNFKRREMIKLGASSLFFLFIIPKCGRVIPLMKGKPLLYKRSRKKLKNNYTFNITDGFYLHSGKKKNVIHYFFNAKSPSMKSIGENEMKQLSKKLKKIDVAEILDNSNINKYVIPYWPFIFENEAYSHAMKEDYILAIKILLFSLAYSAGRGSNYIRYNNSRIPFQTVDGIKVSYLQNRITSFLVGMILRAEKHLPQDEIIKMSLLIKDRMNPIPEYILKRDFMSFYRTNSYYIKKWQSAKKIAWHFPQRLSLQ